jgi:hypothetical protein
MPGVWLHRAAIKTLPTLSGQPIAYLDFRSHLLVSLDRLGQMGCKPYICQLTGES